jgi:tRNA pseudouridine38-40 synthase
MSSFRLNLAYDGTEFFGSQVQSNRRTVQGELLGALRSLGQETARVILAGRTDRGVHAVGQVGAVALSGWNGGPLELDRALAARLPRDLAATEIHLCDADFHPRFDASWREYRYWLAPRIRDPRLGRYAWLLRTAVRVDAMAEAACNVVGRHDFATFASGGEGVPWAERALRPQGTTRTVFRCDVRERESWPGAAGVVEIRIVADGFLPRMVRNIAGALVEIGQDRRSPEWMGELLAARDRRHGPPAAPAHGLTLWAIGYGADPIEEST